MAGEKQTNVWPLPKFYFSVSIGGEDDVAFQEALGLDTDTKVIDYRDGNIPVYDTVKMPGIHKTGHVTLRKGVFLNGTKFHDWYINVNMNTIKRETVVIKLLDQAGKLTMNWTLQNAWPTKITVANLKATGNEVAVETVELAHEGITISNA